MRLIVLGAAIVGIQLWSFADGHPGGLDSKGGHHNRKTGEYHYHRPKVVPPSRPSSIVPPAQRPGINKEGIGQKKLSEADYRDWWAKQLPNALTEVRMPDGTRCDIVSSSHAIEVEWAYKWYEGLGQSLWYAYQRNKTPGIVMILRSEEDRKFVIRLKTLAKHHNIKVDVWVVGPGLRK